MVERISGEEVDRWPDVVGSREEDVAVLCQALEIPKKGCSSSRPRPVPAGTVIDIYVMVRAGIVDQVTLQASSDLQNWVNLGVLEKMGLGIGSYYVPIFDDYGDSVVLSAPFVRAVLCTSPVAADDAEAACNLRIVPR